MHRRAALASLRGMTITRKWEEETAVTMKHVWFTDCQSLHDYLVNPVAAGCEDKRLEIDLEALRENLWEHPDGSPKDSIDEDIHDKPRWIDTSTMICDPLTKAGNDKFYDRLVECMKTGWFDLTATAESILCKMRKQKNSKTLKELQTKPEDHTVATDDVEPYWA